MFEIVVWVFAIYGLLKLIEDIFEIVEVNRVLKGETNIRLRVFNKETTIKKDIEKIIENLPETRVIVQDAGSSDDTYKILLELEKKYDKLIVTRL